MLQRPCDYLIWTLLTLQYHYTLAFSCVDMQNISSGKCPGRLENGLRIGEFQINGLWHTCLNQCDISVIKIYLIAKNQIVPNGWINYSRIWIWIWTVRTEKSEDYPPPPRQILASVKWVPPKKKKKLNCPCDTKFYFHDFWVAKKKKDNKKAQKNIKFVSGFTDSWNCICVSHSPAESKVLEVDKKTVIVSVS